jgi:glutamine amidotransferase
VIGIVNYGSGNINAIANIYKRLNISYVISGDPSELEKVSHLLLPGVGAFDETMRTLRKTGLRYFLEDMVMEKQRPLMGICVGMQLLAEGSEEGDLEGLGWIKGYVKKFDPSLFPVKPHIPHLGWNTVDVKKGHPIFENIDNRKGFYFLHSYYFDCKNGNDILGTTEYGLVYASAVNHRNVFGMQFHPEKSHQNGLTIFNNFSKI